MSKKAMLQVRQRAVKNERETKNKRKKGTATHPDMKNGPEKIDLLLAAAGPSAAAGIARTKEACPKRRVVTYLRFVFQPVAPSHL